MTTSALFFARHAMKFHPIRQFHLTSRAFQERFYTKKHEWVQLLSNQNQVRIGISDYAQNALGDVVYCELPAIGTKYSRDQAFATLESVKAVAECFMPIDGQISKVNEQVKSQADLINKSPYDNGWLVEAKIDEKNKRDIGKILMNEKKYQEYLQTNKQANDH